MAHPPKRRRAPAKTPPQTRETTLTIDHIGHRGDGTARVDGHTVFVPNALAGEVVRAAVTGERGRLLDIVSPSPDRITPFCPQFDTCGGCTSQHVGPDAYSLWKRGIVEIALRNRGIEIALDPMIDAHGQGRRRATFHVRAVGANWVVGYSEARGHTIVDLAHCPILVPELAHAPDIVRTLAGAVQGARRFDAQLTLTDTGIDVHLIGLGEPDLKIRTDLTAIADRLDLARIAIDGEIILARRQPRIKTGLATLTPPPGVFLQATQAGEQALADLVSAHLNGQKRIVDLFAGLGPFALRLAADAAVHATDSDAAAIAALDRAAREATPKLRPIKTETRDLARRPLLAHELDAFDGAVFDPPRAGAEAQARMLAASKIPIVVGVSCDPASFARDAALLIAGGYRLDRVSPVDQFKWSPHIEVVGLFRR